MHRTTYLLFLSIAVTALSPSCRPDVCPEARRVDVDFHGDCIGAFDYDHDFKDIAITPRPECPWERLVNLNIFSGFRPGMTINEARDEFGPPDSEMEVSTNRLWRYRRPHGAVQIGHEDQGSGLPFIYWWTLSFIPDDQVPELPELYFSKEVATRLTQYENVREIVILNQCGTPMVAASIEGGRIREIDWTNNRDSYHPERFGGASHP